MEIANLIVALFLLVVLVAGALGGFHLRKSLSGHDQISFLSRCCVRLL